MESNNKTLTSTKWHSQAERGSKLGIIILFGVKKIPELARGLSKGLHEFKKTTQKIKDEVGTVTKKVTKIKDE